MTLLIKGNCDKCGGDLAYQRRALDDEHRFDMTTPGGSVVNLYKCLGCGQQWVTRENAAYSGYDPLESWVRQFPGLQAASRELWKAIKHEFDVQQPPMTVRQMFYRMSSTGQAPKTEQGYRKVQYALTEMRKAGAIPYGWLADNTRWVSKDDTFDGISHALDQMQQYYRRALWSTQPCHVEVWLEKDALRGVVTSITREYDVPLYVTRGYPSLSYLHEAAEAIKGIDKPVHILHLGDFDASGQDAARSIREGLAKFGAVFTFHQIAVTERQIAEMSLQTRPSKPSDPRAARHGAVAVELDAIPPQTLRQMVRDAIEYFVDEDELAFMRQIEQQERARIADMARGFGTSTN
jgi:hypothetical protein